MEIENETSTDAALSDVNIDANINSDGHATRVGEMNDDNHATEHSTVEVDSSAAAAGKCRLWAVS
jgi:hypothetical protein